MILIAAGSLFGIIAIVVGVFVIAAVICATLGDPLFAETPAEEFADDEPRVRTCARARCNAPVWRDSLCQGHHEYMVDQMYEFRREIEDYERGLSL